MWRKSRGRAAVAFGLLASMGAAGGCAAAATGRPAADEGSSPALPRFAPPPYASRDRFVEREVRIPGDPPIRASLCLPRATEPGAGRPAAALLVAGWGTTDRDGTVGPNKPMRDLAWGLATHGIAVLRFDPPRVLGPIARDGADASIESAVVEPALAALRYLLRRPEVSERRVVAIGHSLGGLAVARLGRREPALAGLVLVAVSSRPLERVVLDQLRHVVELDGVTTDRERAMLATLAAQAERVAGLDENATLEPSELPLGMPVEFWLDLRRHPLEAQVDGEVRPVLVVNGGRDYQVTDQDFAGWQRLLAGNPRASFRRYPTLNHLLMPSCGARSPTEYRTAGHVSAEVVADIAAWTNALGR